MTVREMLARIDSRELAEWIAYDTIEPIGEQRTDMACGVIASTIANCHRPKGHSAFKPLDFMPVQRNSDESEPENVIAQVHALAALVPHTHTVEEDSARGED